MGDLVDLFKLIVVWFREELTEMVRKLVGYILMILKSVSRISVQLVDLIPHSVMDSGFMEEARIAFTIL